MPTSADVLCRLRHCEMKEASLSAPSRSRGDDFTEFIGPSLEFRNFRQRRATDALGEGASKIE